MLKTIRDLSEKKQRALLRELGRRDPHRNSKGKWTSKAKTLEEAEAPGAEIFAIDESTNSLQIEMASYVWNGRYWQFIET